MLYLNNGTANPFSAVAGSIIGYEHGTTRSVALGDMDGDGDIDLVVGRHDQTNLLYLNAGEKTPFVRIQGYDIGADTGLTSSIALADMDLDGRLDVVARQ